METTCSGGGASAILYLKVKLLNPQRKKHKEGNIQPISEKEA